MAAAKGKRRRTAKSASRRKRAKPGRTRRTARGIRKHQVKAKLANFELAKARSSLNLEIYLNEEKIGELEIGRGSLFWYGRNRHKSKRLRWSRFVKMMDELAYGEHLPAGEG
jgi:hypothetical protein